tara:strand:- start:2737 stop:3687 length:951 start_codon:yes stop_codon:yes gene_type:complete
MVTEQSPAAQLKSLIKSGETIIIPGAHDPLMGRILERMGFKCCQCAGWMTGAHLVTPEPVMTMTEQIEAARKVADHVNIPVISDAGTGYGEPVHIMRTVKEFHKAGIARINIEDQFFPKRASYHRGLEHVVGFDEFMRRIEFALKSREENGADILISGRTDAGNAVNGSWKEAGRRARALKEMGVDSIQPMTRTKDSMERFRQEFPDTDATLSTTTYFNGLPIEEITAYGFQMISYPLATILASVAGVIDLWKGVQETGVASFDMEKAKEVREEIEDAIGLPDMWEIERQTVEYDNKHLEGRQVAGYEGYNQTEKK